QPVEHRGQVAVLKRLFGDERSAGAALQLAREVRHVAADGRLTLELDEELMHYLRVASARREDQNTLFHLLLGRTQHGCAAAIVRKPRHHALEVLERGADLQTAGAQFELANRALMRLRSTLDGRDRGQDLASRFEESEQ